MGTFKGTILESKSLWDTLDLPTNWEDMVVEAKRKPQIRRKEHHLELVGSLYRGMVEPILEIACLL